MVGVQTTTSLHRNNQHSGIRSHCTHCKYLNSLPNSVVDACTVNAFKAKYIYGQRSWPSGHIYTLFKARLDKFWKHQSVKFDFTADLTGTGNRSEEVIK